MVGILNVHNYVYNSQHDLIDYEQLIITVQNRHSIVKEFFLCIAVRAGH